MLTTAPGQALQQQRFLSFRVGREAAQHDFRHQIRVGQQGITDGVVIYACPDALLLNQLAAGGGLATDVRIQLALLSPLPNQLGQHLLIAKGGQQRPQ